MMKTSTKKHFWDHQTLEWYIRAAEQNEYHARMAALVAPLIPAGETVCDLGCGAGYLSQALLKYIPQVTALDRDDAALEVLRRRSVGQRGLEILEADASALPGDWVWDNLVLCFFGRITKEENLKRYLSHARKRLIYIVNSDTRSSFSASGRSHCDKEYVSRVSAFLEQNQIPYQLEECALEFGQPLASLAEAEAFVRRYSPRGYEWQVEEKLEQRLQLRPDGSWYMPHQKRFGIFTIEKKEQLQ